MLITNIDHWHVIICERLFDFLCPVLLVCNSTSGVTPPPQSLTSVRLLLGDQENSGHPPTSYGQPGPVYHSDSDHDTTQTNTAPAGSQLNTTIPSPSLGAGLTLSPAAEPFPQKLVEKLQSGQFVEMRELLADNMALANQLAVADLDQFPRKPPLLDYNIAKYK